MSELASESTNTVSPRMRAPSTSPKVLVWWISEALA